MKHNFFFVISLLVLWFCAENDAINCRVIKNKRIKVDVANIPFSFNVTKINLINITSQYNFASVASNMPVVCRKFIKRMPAVEYLWMKNVSVKDIEAGAFSDLKRLKSLYLVKNTINKITIGTFSNMLKLKSLFLSNNQITTIEYGAFENLPSLEEIGLSHNKIKTIQEDWFTGCRKLAVINLFSNNLKEISATHFKNIIPFQWVSIDLGQNQIEKINKGAFAKLAYVKHLSLRNNSIKELPSDFLATARKGKILDLDQNNLHCVSKDVLVKFQIVYTKNNPLSKHCVNRLNSVEKLNKIAIY